MHSERAVDIFDCSYSEAAAGLGQSAYRRCSHFRVDAMPAMVTCLHVARAAKDV